ncbi:hypothetical protein PI95_008915 [Hassallia byssoidea VB512170]|uniref:Uncharacterized protein n=1 Tax=Hassallia byssoidea VB512170 TaxID=1304833 RepID=A0A846H4Z0_9CYAN|nr:hypothetical protein [Hassalia byssoidea]NEU72687.1 hypothetical protein [Hassalia byssoidea VB512170]
MSEKHRHEQQIYSLLPQSFWTLPRTPIGYYRARGGKESYCCAEAE